MKSLRSYGRQVKLRVRLAPTIARSEGKSIWKSKSPLSVLLVASFPILHLYAANSHSVEAIEVIRPLLLSYALALSCWLVFGIATRNWVKSSIISMIAILLLLSYGHIYDWLRSFGGAGMLIGRHRYLLPLAAILFVGLASLIIRSPQSMESLAVALGWLGGGLILVPMLSLIWNLVAKNEDLADQFLPEFEISGPTHGPDEPMPDIYYIILDGYGRQDILQDLYGYDNSAFINSLAEMGFYVAEESRSNYIQTELSLITALNMAYIQDLATEYGFDLDMIPAAELIRSNRVMGLLVREGYQTVAFNTGFRSTTIRDADLFLEGPSQMRISLIEAILGPPSHFEGLVLETTPLRILSDRIQEPFIQAELPLLEPSYQQHRDLIRYILSEIDRIAELEGEYFVFAHILAPHPPFVFGPEGEPLTPSYAFTLNDGSHYLKHSSREDYLSKYPDQLQYLNSLVLAALQRIIDNSEPRPIIILQGDHGPGAYLSWESLEESDIAERTSILNAYLLPDPMVAKLYPTISPVNSFRLVLGSLFRVPLTLHDDQSYFSHHEGSLNLTPLD